jgi:multidrug efflux system membrane fusion protein
MLDMEGVPPGVLTWLPQPGATIGRGERLYEVNDQPVVLMLGVQPMHRRLASGASGPDVKQLEENLLALGFGSRDGLVADGHFGSADAAAVCDWQASLGVPQTGVVDLGAIVFAPGPVRIAGLHGGLGSAYAPGQPVIDVTDTSRIVSVSLDAALQRNVKVGDGVSVQLPGANQPAAGKVSAISSVAQTASGSGGQQPQGPVHATVAVTIRLDDPNAGAGLDQAPVRVAITDSVRSNVLAVPVTALVAQSDGTFAVRVVHGSARTSVKVTTGVFGDNGLVEVSGQGPRRR